MLNEVFNPQNYNLDLNALMAILVSTVIFVMGLFTLIREWYSQIRLQYFLFSFSLFLIFFSSIFARTAINVDVMPFWDFTSHVGIIMLPPVFLIFSSAILQFEKNKKNLINVCWLISIAFFLVFMFTDLFVNGYTKFSWGFESNYGIAAILFIIFLSAMVFHVIYMYWSVMKSSERNSAIWNRARWMFIANLVGFLSIIDFAPAFGIEMYPVGATFIMVMFFLMSIVTWRYKLVDIDVRYAADRIINTMHDALVVLDGTFQIKLTNDAVGDFFQKKQYDILTNMLTEKILSCSFKTDGFKEVRELELELIDSNKKVRYIELSISVIKRQTAELTAYICILHEITSRKQVEEALKKSHQGLEQRVEERTARLAHEIDRHITTTRSLSVAKEEAEAANKMMGQFLANISHELRTPMHGILGFSELGLKQLNEMDESKIKQYFSNIKVSGNRLLSLLNDLLDISRLEAGKMKMHFKSADLEDLTRHCLLEQSALLKDKHINCQISSEMPDTRLECDAGRMSQVITNLIGNAIQFSPVGGSIYIGFNKSKIKQSNKEEQDKMVPGIKFYIEDEGIGIPGEELEMVFDKFIQSSRTDFGGGGTGLGLAICREILNYHHGVVYASLGKKGARLVFCLPIIQQGKNNEK